MQDRRKFIGGSDAKRILDGDWLDLYLEKTGQKAPEDLEHNFKVKLGEFTEFFHIDWLNKYHGFEILPPVERFYHREHPMLAALLDGWCTHHDTFVDCKHTNSRSTRDTMVEWHQPQIAHYCNVMDVRAGWLSFIAGNEEPQYFKLEPSPKYRAELLEHELRFWWHVENYVPPEIVPTAALDRTKALAAKARIDDMRAVDMTGNNMWAANARTYLDTQDAAASFDAAKKALKEMVEADVREATGHGVCIKRSKSGSLLFSTQKEPVA